MGSVITAGLKSLAGNLAAKTATAKGNVMKGLKGLRDKGVVKKAFRSMAMVGLTTSILGGAASAHPNTDIISELTNRVITATTKSMLYAATGIVIGGEKPSKALQSAYKSAIAHTLCSTMAGRLGKAYHAGQLPDVIHEGLHGLVGVMGAKIQNRSALAGAVGAISGEVFGKLYSQNSKVFNNPNASVDDLQKAVDRGIELAEITAASVATLFKLDANAAVSAATIAASENSFKKQKEKLARLLKNIKTDQQEREEYLAQQQAEAQAKRETLQEIIDEIKADPAGFAKTCGLVVADGFVPGGLQNAVDYLKGAKSSDATIDAIGEDLVLMFMTAGAGKSGKTAAKVGRGIKVRYQSKLAKALKKVERPNSSKYYTSIFTAKLSKNSYPKLSRKRHNQLANEKLHDVFQKDKIFAKKLESIYPGIIKGVSPGAKGAYSRSAPTPDVTWHHAPESGLLELVPKKHHTDSGIVQKYLHPGGVGGFSKWGK